MSNSRADQNRQVLSPATQTRVMQFGARAFWPQGFQIYEQGSAADGVFVVLSGRIILRNRIKTGRAFVPAVTNPGATFGSEGLCVGARYRTDAVAAERSETLHIGSARFREFLRERPMDAVEMVGQLSAERGHLLDKLQELAAMNVDQRLISSLSRLAQCGGLQAENGYFHIPATNQRLLCEMVGATRESIGLALNRLVTVGAAERRGSGFLISAAALQNSPAVAVPGSPTDLERRAATLARTSRLESSPLASGVS